MAERHFRPVDACRFLLEEFGIKRAPGTLAKARCWGGDAPEFRRLGRAVYYAEADLRAWAERSLGTSFRNTSDTKGRCNAAVREQKADTP